MKYLEIAQEKCLTILICLFLLFSISISNVWAENRSSLFDRSQIENCEGTQACSNETDRPKPDNATPLVGQPSDTPEHNASNDSYLSNRWELDDEKPRDKYVIMTHRSNYMLPFSYNDSPNREPFEEASNDLDVQETEVTFQLSLKIKLWQDVFGKDMDLWFGYTQRSFWQLYTFEDSSPFRETNYEPELLLNFRTDFPFLGMKGRIINVGLNHQSNGRSEPLSRSWNRIVGNLGFEKDNFTLLVKAWYRIPENKEDDDNPETDDYMGPGEIWGYYFWNKHRLGVMLRNNLRPNDNRGALQLEWAFPLFGKITGYIQYFRGYGESLLDYNHGIDRIGIGLILNDWD